MHEAVYNEGTLLIKEACENISQIANPSTSRWGIICAVNGCWG